MTNREEQREVGTEGRADGGQGASPPSVMAVDLTDPAAVQPVVEPMCRIILSIYMRSDKNKTNKANEAKLDQSEYMKDGGGGDKGERDQLWCPNNDALRDWSGPYARCCVRPATPAPPVAATAPTPVVAAAVTAVAATTMTATSLAEALVAEPLRWRNLST